MHLRRSIFPIVLALVMTGCMKWDYGRKEDFTASGSGLFIVCEGNFQYGNATLSYYDPAARKVENGVFQRANGFKLGDVGQSMTLHGGLGWIVVSTSRVVFAIDPATFKERGRIKGFTTPRYIHFVNDRKAYVSQLWDPRIAVVDPKKYEITGYIDCPGMNFETGSTEQMAQWGDYVFVACWSYQKRVLVIDTRTDEVCGQIEVGIQPTSLVVDRNGKLWVLTDGGYKGSPYGYEAPSLWRIDAETQVVEKRFDLALGEGASELQINGAGDRIYWINDAVWQMSVDDERLPARPFLEAQKTKYYGLTVDPRTSEVYVADAIDYQQPGIIYRYTTAGELVDQFYTGVAPSAFCWK